MTIKTMIIDDGRNDCFVCINGVKTFIFTQEGQRELRVTHEQAQQMTVEFSKLFLAALKLAGAEEAGQ